MDQHLHTILQKRIEKTLSHLRKNNMNAMYFATTAEAVSAVQNLIPEGSKVAFGGSMTLEESGVMSHLRSGRYHLLDRNIPGITPEAVRKIYREAFTADVYLCSSNAITEHGELYNVDGSSNRVAAMLYGPDNVIVVAGYNKIVTDLAEADLRMKTIAAPANATRLNCKTPCVPTGRCQDCQSENRICCNAVTMGKQRIPGRITVLIIGEILGY